MDLNTVTGFRRARTRADLALRPGEQLLGGGTWLFSEPQESTGLVDLTTMGWPSLEIGDGLRIAATCTIADLVGLAPQPGWSAQRLFTQCANALLASFKVWNVATVGGNVCRSFAAAGMVSLCAALDGVAEIWSTAGDTYRIPVAELVVDDGMNTLGPGEVLRALELPGHALRSRTGFRKIALAELGRSGAVLTGRVDEDGSAVFTVTAATRRPIVLRYNGIPSGDRLRDDVDAVDCYYTDPLGSADWRRQVAGILVEEIRAELS
ncbi:FAD binding domain-containing protein [Pseudonocardia ailaonensis]|uniref:FAD binding domain-containing protein n=1 Tax=Pseudonocardia ailaonensis TaxID=367279 RepID=A0ABN2N0Z8_9PSEU